MSNPEKSHGISRRFALALPAALAAAAVVPEAQAAASTAVQSAAPVIPTAAIAANTIKGPDGLTDWQRDKLAYYEVIFDQRQPPIRPMASVAGLSPAFARMAIKLDVALCEYRHVASYDHRIHVGVDHHEIPQSIVDATGTEIINPFLHRMFEAQEKAYLTVARLIRKIEESKPITRGDRMVRKRANSLRNCNGFHQLEGYDDWWVYARRTSWNNAG